MEENEKITEYKILDHGYIKLIEHWGSDERIIESARMSTGKGFLGWGEETCRESTDRTATCERGIRGCAAKHVGDEKLLKYLWKNKHATPFEMAGATIEVAAPIFVFREWHRHRTQSYSEISARYVPLPNESYIPDAHDLVMRSQLAAASANRQAGTVDGTVISDEDAESWLSRLASLYDQIEVHYQLGLTLGVPKELARLPLPVGRYSRMRASANLRNWIGFLTLRNAPQAQKEIRLYAAALAKILATKFPRTAEVAELEMGL